MRQCDNESNPFQILKNISMSELEIYTNFINKFVYKNKRERVYFELTNLKKRNEFLNKLNHNSLDLFDNKKLNLVPKSGNVKNYIVENLNIDVKDLCLIISNYDYLDNQTMSFEKAFEMCNGLGFSTLLVFIDQNKIYLQTEQELGSSIKYIGI